MNPVDVKEGHGPIILGQPHSGTYVPADIYEDLNELGRKLLDTDWHVPQLYENLLPDATIVSANFSRYVIDANRDPEGASLYPGQNTTQLVPLMSFDGKPIWENPPDEAKITRRKEVFHTAYHNALKAQIVRVKSAHGFAILYDCHSIRSEIPFLFDDRLPDFNIGDNDGMTCHNAITQAVHKACMAQAEFSYVVNGRFRGGWTTRYYGQPDIGVHAIQMELAQRRYLQTEEPPFAYDHDKAKPLRAILANILEAIQAASHMHLTPEI
ncbi:MAG: N-formylglutamate deformylase [Litorimonas sp.]